MENLFLAAPFIIGLMHCLEPDHLIAVSALVKDDGTLLRDASKGASWGVGHSIPVMCLGMVYVLFNMSVEQHMSLELPVGIMLIFLGAIRLRQILKVNAHETSRISNLSFLSVGVVHGLAGTGSIIVLLSSRQTGVFNQSSFLILFCAGLTLGMATMTGLLSNVLPLLTKMKGVRIVLPVLSIAYGFLIVIQNI